MSGHDVGTDLSIYWPSMAITDAVGGALHRQVRTVPAHELTTTVHVPDMNEHNTQATSRRLLSQTELAEYLQVPVRTIEDWRTRSYGPRFIRVGRRVRYRETDVDSWLDAQAAA